MTPWPRHRLRPALDRLEARDMPAGWTAALYAPAQPPVDRAPADPAPLGATSAAAAGQRDTSVGGRVAAFAAAHLGLRVGGGECAQLAAEALRVAGARFTVFGAGSADYVWGSLVTQVTGGAGGGAYSNPAAIRPGDVLQYTNARFRDGTTAARNTAVVAAVDAAGRVAAVYQQNFDRVRAVTRQPLDLSTLVVGSVKVYRPVPRAAVPGVFRFSVVNNTGGPVAVTERAGTGAATYGLSRANTAASYQARAWTTYGGVRPVLTVVGRSVPVEDGAGYEIYRGPAGAVAVRKVAA